MDTKTLTVIRRMIERGMDDATIMEMIEVFGVSTIPHPAHPPVLTVLPAPVAPAYTKPDQTRTMYRLTPTGRKQAITGNNGAVIAYFNANNNAWADTRAMRSAGVLAHGEHDGKNKALESAIHGMKVRGWLTMRDKPGTSTAAPPTARPINGITLT